MADRLDLSNFIVDREGRIPYVQPPLDGELEKMLLKTPLIEGRPINLFMVLGRNVPVMKRWNSLGHTLLTGGVPDHTVEIVVLRTGWRCGSEYEFGMHVVRGSRFGVTSEEVSQLMNDQVDRMFWDATHADLLDMVDELCGEETISDEVWTRLAARWSDEDLVQLVVLCGYYRMVSCFMNAMRIPLDVGVEGWPTDACS